MIRFSACFAPAVSAGFVVAGLLGAIAPVEAQSNEPASLGVFDDWEAFTYESEGSQVCYVISKPKDSASSKPGAKRDPVRFMVTNWPSHKVRGQPSIIIGYPIREGSLVKLSIDDQAFDLYPDKDAAWVYKDETEKAVIAAMKSGKDMRVKGTSQKGTETTDLYSLSGISAALGMIDSACK